MATLKELKKIIEDKDKEISILKGVVNVDYNMEDPSPSDVEERREYVARCGSFFKDILEKKLEHLISDIQRELSNPLNPREMDVYLKANINACCLLLDWGESMENERLANVINSKEE